LAGVIRFALQQLSTRNAHHEFEHICRHIARLRICSNILPATGPVASGGDQGRDFESFRTYLANNLRSTSTFVGLASSKPVAFGCTLQAKNLKKKIKGDVKTIAAGQPCDSVHYFLGVDFAVAKRHEVQEEVRTAHSIQIEIYDAAAITEFLCERDLFWIANEYLSIPADAYPRDEDVDDWYATLRTQWSNPSNRHITYASFQAVKRATRSLLTHTDRQADVTLWIDCLRIYRDGSDPRLADMARYEIAVVSERIKSSMSGLDDDIRGFFSRALSSSDPTRLIDANCLLQYATVANLRGTTQVTVDELKEVRVKLQQRAKQLLDDAESATELCVALDLAANVQVAMEPGLRTPPDPAPAFQLWNRIADLVDRAPLFPLQELTDRLVQWLPLLVDRPEYEPLMAKLDAAVAQRTGRFAAANNCAARAKRLSEDGRLVQAIRELNRAKIDWFSSETLPLALGSMLLVARHYSSLGLVFAAKYYALAVAYLALPGDNQRVKPLIARSLFLAAECDYTSGAWLQALSLLRAAQVGQAHYVSKELEDDDSDLRRLLLYGAIIYGVSEHAAPAIRDQVAELTKDWPDLDALKAGAAKAEATFIKESADGREARTTFFRAPFSECGEHQTLEWSALGLEWIVTWKTGRDLNLAAEQFIAVAQIVTCDLVRSDLYIVPSRVRVEIVAGPTNTHVEAERLHDNTMSHWRVTIPSGPPTADRHLEDVAVVAQILHEQSLRSDKWPVFEALGKEGLFQNTMVGTHYSTVYSAVNAMPVLIAPTNPTAAFRR
jgi:hypothetical protein